MSERTQNLTVSAESLGAAMFLFCFHFARNRAVITAFMAAVNTSRGSEPRAAGAACFIQTLSGPNDQTYPFSAAHERRL